jgi:hypothetical protein
VSGRAVRHSSTCGVAHFYNRKTDGIEIDSIAESWHIEEIAETDQAGHRNGAAGK